MSRRNKEPSYDRDEGEKHRFIIAGAVAMVFVAGLLLIVNGLTA